MLEALVSPKRLKKGNAKAMAYAPLPINFLLELACLLNIDFKAFQLSEGIFGQEQFA